MHPHLVAVDELGLSIGSYGVCLALAAALGALVGSAEARRARLDPAAVRGIGLALVAIAFVGAKLLMIVVAPEGFRPVTLLSPPTFASTGGIFYGGLLAALGASVVLTRRAGLSWWSFADCAAPAAALGHAVGRVGCFLAGCCWGRPTQLPWAVSFPYEAYLNAGAPCAISLHPVQLYEAVLELGIFLVLRGRQTSKPFEGAVLAGYLLLYGVGRCALELFRADDRGGIGGVSTSQAIAVGLGVVAVAIVIRKSGSVSTAFGRSPAAR